MIGPYSDWLFRLIKQKSSKFRVRSILSDAKKRDKDNRRDTKARQARNNGI